MCSCGKDELVYSYLTALFDMVCIVCFQGKSGVAGPPGDRGNPGRRVSDFVCDFICIFFLLFNG